MKVQASGPLKRPLKREELGALKRAYLGLRQRLVFKVLYSGVGHAVGLTVAVFLLVVGVVLFGGVQVGVIQLFMFSWLATAVLTNRWVYRDELDALRGDVLKAKRKWYRARGKRVDF